MATRVRTIKVTDLAKAVDKAISGTELRKIPGGFIMGRLIPPTKGFDAEAAARQITREVQKSFPELKLTPKVGGGTMGFICKIPTVDF